MHPIPLIAASLLLALEPVSCRDPGNDARQEPVSVRLLDAASLERLREAHAVGSPLYRDEIAELIQESDKRLRQEAYSVTQKKILPPSGDLHDYLSWSRYWWPDSTKPGGLPYVRRDGKVNPEILNIPDHENLVRMVAATNTLALGYAVTGNRRYSDKAVEILTGWFIDPETRMNPNLAYSQLIPGRTAVRGTGILDGRKFSTLVDAITILEASGSMSPEVGRELRSWFSQYFEWLTTSEHGRLEAAATNNHGTWYDVQVVAIALYNGKTSHARSVLERAKRSRIEELIEPDGSQPSELARTRSWHYSIFNLEALTRLARMAESVSVDLWNHSSSDGRSITAALKYLAPFASGESPWPHEELGSVSNQAYADLLVLAASRCTDPELRRLAESFGGSSLEVQQLTELTDRSTQP